MGSSRTKVAVFNSNELENQATLEAPIAEQLKDWLPDPHTIQACVLSSVASEDPALLSFLSSFPFFVQVEAGMRTPLKMAYESPETLGNDRLAAAIGAWFIHPGKDLLVIDAGTCITMDLVTHDATYHGGSISPGLMMRFRAMHQFTARLPLVSPSDDASLTGRNTAASIRSGAQNGILAEVHGMVARYRQQFPHLKVVLTGGDASFFESNLKFDIFVAPNLVLEGLNYILNEHTTH